MTEAHIPAAVRVSVGVCARVVPGDVYETFIGVCGTSHGFSRKNQGRPIGRREHQLTDVNEGPDEGRAAGGGSPPTTQPPDGTDWTPGFRVSAFIARLQSGFAYGGRLGSLLEEPSVPIGASRASRWAGGRRRRSRASASGRMGRSPAAQPEASSPECSSFRPRAVPVAARCGAGAVPEPALRERSGQAPEKPAAQALYSNWGGAR